MKTLNIDIQNILNEHVDIEIHEEINKIIVNLLSHSDYIIYLHHLANNDIKESSRFLYDRLGKITFKINDALIEPTSLKAFITYDILFNGIPYEELN